MPPRRRAAPRPGAVPGAGTRGAGGITPVGYRPFLDAPIGVDLLDFPELADRGRLRGLDLGSPLRPDFHHLIHVTGGRIRHTVDFHEYLLPAGSWLWVRAGQVHRYTPADLALARGAIVIWQPGFTPAEPPFDAGPVLPGPPHARALALALRHLAHAHDDLSAMPLDAHLKTLRLLLDVLLLRLVHSRGRSPNRGAAARADDTFGSYEAAVEREFTRKHRVGDYASALGYSVRTLTRATLAATGSTAKQFIDARVLLEARRLLAYSELTSAEIARHLGFADPGDFGKFFRRHDGRTPLAFRAASRTPASPTSG